MNANIVADNSKSKYKYTLNAKCNYENQINVYRDLTSIPTDPPENFSPVYYKRITDIAKNLGVSWSKVINLDYVVVADWVTLKCQFGCRHYNTNLSCPPQSPPPSLMRKILDEYEFGLLIVYDCFETIDDKNWKIIQQTIPRIEREIFLLGNHKAFGFATGPCHFCKEGCNPTGPCVHPKKMRPAMEACGIDVYQTFRNVGLELETVNTHFSVKTATRYSGLILL